MILAPSSSEIGENFGGEIKPVSAEARSSQKAPLGGAGEMQDRCESISPPNTPGPLTSAVSDGKPSIPNPEASGTKTGGASRSGRAGAEPVHCHANSGCAVTKIRANGMPQELRERICREYAAGVPSPVLAARYGFSHGYIRSIASKAGASTRTATVKRARQPKFTAQQITDIARRMRSGAAAIAIAADYGMSDEALRSRALRIPALREIGFNSPSPRVKTSNRTGYATGIRRHAPLARIAEPIPTDGVDLMEILRLNLCKWPSSADPVVFCCKARRVAGKPYCAPHQARAYRSEAV